MGMSSSMVKFSVYYEEMRYVVVADQAAISFQQLLGIIGGQFGLFMGASYLSFIEIVEMLFMVSRVFFQNRKKQKEIQHNKEFDNKKEDTPPVYYID
jgi:hypothetical protein